MNNYMMIVIVPLGVADKVIKAANDAGALGATILRARGANASACDRLFSLKIEPEEEVILIVASQEVINEACAKINEKKCMKSGSVYVLPLQS